MSRSNVPGSAVFDETEQYRYLLTREIGPAPLRILWVMLNPSTATAEVNDPTIRRCMGFSERWGYGVMHVCNIFALRSTDPKGLYSHPDPVGPDNDNVIAIEAARADLVVCAWGAHGKFQGRGAKVYDIIRQFQVPVVLKLTKDGQPGHPLYVANSTQVSIWNRVT